MAELFLAAVSSDFVPAMSWLFVQGATVGTCLLSLRRDDPVWDGLHLMMLDCQWGALHSRSLWYQSKVGVCHCPDPAMAETNASCWIASDTDVASWVEMAANYCSRWVRFIVSRWYLQGAELISAASQKSEVTYDWLVWHPGIRVHMASGAVT